MKVLYNFAAPYKNFSKRKMFARIAYNFYLNEKKKTLK